MFARIFSTLLLWAATLFVIIYFNTAGWTVIVAALAAAALHETFAIMRKTGLEPSGKIGQTVSLAIFVGTFAGMYFGVLFGGALAYGLGIVAAAVGIVKNPYGGYFSKTFLPTVAAVGAIAFMLHFLVITAMFGGQNPYCGIVLAIWILAAAKFSDVGAYVIGCAFGRHKLAESISPKKTWEGAVGGLVSSAAVSAAIACGFADILPAQFTPPVAAVAGTAIGAIAIVSDLLESVFKRVAGVKDSGAMIPGIGGALDLADSILLSAPVGTLFIVLIYIF